MSETNEKTRADEIRRKVTEIFKAATEAEHELAQNDMARFLDTLPEIREFFDFTVEMIKELHKSESDAPRVVELDAELREKLRAGILQRVFVTYPAWHVATSLTDTQILAAAEKVSDILSACPPYTTEQVERLEPLFAKERGLDYEMPLGDSRLHYLAAIGNLRYYFVACASCAKKLDSFAAARRFLKAASILGTGKERVPPYFKEDEADEVLDLFEEGVSELRMALDYRNLQDWDQLLADARERESKDAAK